MSFPVGMVITTTVVAVTNASTSVVPENPYRKYLALCNVGTGLASLNFDAPAVAGQGWPLTAAGTVGDQGGALIFESSFLTKQAVNAISAAGTTIVVLEGV